MNEHQLRDLLPLLVVVGGCFVSLFAVHFFTLRQQRRAAARETTVPGDLSAAREQAPPRQPYKAPEQVAGYAVPQLLRRVLEDDTLDFLQSLEFSEPRVSAFPLPLPGWVPFCSVGNGDEHGLYWPLGRNQPIILISSHDAWSFIPQAASFESYLLQEFTEYYSLPEREAASEDIKADRKQLSLLIGDVPWKPGTTRDHAAMVELLAELDPKSPLLCTIRGDIALEDGRDEDAERLYRTALDVMPEYTAARYELAMLLRRHRRPEAVTELLLTLCSPDCFAGRCFFSNHALPRKRRHIHQQVLEILQRTHASDFPEEFSLLRTELPHVSFKYHPSALPDWRPVYNTALKLLNAGSAQHAYGWLLNAILLAKASHKADGFYLCMDTLKDACMNLEDPRRAEHAAALTAEVKKQ